MNKYIKNIMVIASILMLAGCASDNIKLHVRAAHYLNPDEKGQSEPLRINIYALKKADEFQSNTVDNIISDPDKYLSKTLVDQDAFNIKPSEHTVLSINNNPEIKYLGILAFYRNIAPNNTKLVIRVNQKPSKNVLKKITPHRIEISFNTHDMTQFNNNG